MLCHYLQRQELHQCKTFYHQFHFPHGHNHTHQYMYATHRLEYHQNFHNHCAHIVKSSRLNQEHISSRLGLQNTSHSMLIVIKTCFYVMRTQYVLHACRKPCFGISAFTIACRSSSRSRKRHSIDHVA